MILKRWSFGALLYQTVSAYNDTLTDNLTNVLCSEQAEAVLCNPPYGHPTQQCFNNLQLLAEETCPSENQQNTRTFNFGSGNSWVKRMMKAINGYGCWCYFDGDYTSGKGTPVNTVDEYCKILANGYMCIIIDDDTCDPMTQSYDSGIGLSLSSGAEARTAVLADCTAQNSDDCAIETCAVESYFVLNILTYFLSGNSLDTDQNHSTGSIDTSSTCTVTSSSNGGSSGEICCGTYPERQKFQTRDDSSDRSCCGGHYYDSSGDRACCDSLNVYDSSSLYCCGDGYGTVKSSSSAC